MEKPYCWTKYFCGIISIILCLIAKSSFASGCLRPDQCWTTQDVIDERIDVYAQKALLEMFSNGGNEAATASSMLYAVKCGYLDGIFLPNQRVPALRAQNYGGYWTIFQNTNDNSTCYKKTSQPNQKPIIVFQKRIKSDRQAMSRALSEAWYQCQIPISEARCYGNSGTNSPPTSTNFRATLLVTLIDHRTRKPVPSATIHLLFGAAQVGGGTTDSDGNTVIGIPMRGQYTIAVSGTDAGVAQPTTVDIKRPGVTSKIIELLSRQGSTPPQGATEVCAIGEGNVVQQGLGELIAKKQAREMAIALSLRNLDQEVKKWRASLKRNHGLGARITQTNPITRIINEKQELVESSYIPDTSIPLDIWEYIAEAESCTVINWYKN